MSASDPRASRASLEALQAQLERMCEAGEVDAAGEGVMRRHFEARAEALEAELRGLITEFGQRRARDGETAATQWLADRVEALGRRDGEDTRRVLSTVLEPN